MSDTKCTTATPESTSPSALLVWIADKAEEAAAIPYWVADAACSSLLDELGIKVMRRSTLSVQLLESFDRGREAQRCGYPEAPRPVTHLEVIR
jgi:hypothetical protein